MEELGPGLYEALVTEGLKAQLEGLADRLPARVRDLRAAEAPDRIAWHLSKQIESALATSVTRSGSASGSPWLGRCSIGSANL